MTKSIIEKLAVGASVMLFSMSSLAITFPNNDDDDDDDVIVPIPCEVDCDFTRGPDPSIRYLEAEDGPYTVRTTNVPSSAGSFSGGTIHYPTGTTGTMGAIAVASGFIAPEGDIIWWGPRLASHGFVVITISTPSFDGENRRATQLSEALDYVISESNSSGNAISGMVDATRLGAMGWSMGGGGSLKLATDRELKAIIPTAPYYDQGNDFDTITASTLIIACENDNVASVDGQSSVFYNDIPASTDKALLVIAGGAHSCVTSGNANEDIMGKYGVSWMKRYLDEDARYDQFLCGPNHTADGSISEYRDNCN
ncbi:MAG: triacylglycerol lipase [Oleiphilaceae bacterium]|jgi:triacylglycerol lipase